MKRIIWKFIVWQLFRFNSNLNSDYRRVVEVEPMTREEYIAARLLGGSLGFYRLGIEQPGRHPFFNRK